MTTSPPMHDTDTLARPPATAARTRLLVIGSVWPHVAGGLEAANIVTHALLDRLSASGRFDITFAYVNAEAAVPSAAAQVELDALRARGVRLAPAYLLGARARLRSRAPKVAAALLGGPADVLQEGFGHGERLLAHLATANAVPEGGFDAALVVWSEIGLNLASTLPMRRFAYHGNPDHKVFDAQHEMMRLTGVAPRGAAAVVDALRRALMRRLLTRAHLAVLARYDWVGDVAANDAAYYAAHGVKCDYIANTWPMQPPPDWSARRDRLEAEHGDAIVGSVGNTSATGNSLGFIALAQEVLPALKRRLGARPFTIQIFGGRKPRPYIAPLLADSHIVLRGFVDDLDGEILAAPVFLIANNHHTFKVGHTRFLHAWSLGACVVAFADCRESMPEIEHGVNALLGRTADEVAAHVQAALDDRALRRRIGAGGVHTLATAFAPERVARELATHLDVRLAAATEPNA